MVRCNFMTQPLDERAGLPSASGIPKLIHCAGSRAAELPMPNLPEQDVTATGNAVHAALAGEEEELELSESEIKEKIAATEKAVVIDWLAEFSLPSVTSVIRETRMWIRNRATLDPIASAKPDVAYVSTAGLHALVINYKTGFADQDDSAINWQSRTEALAVWHQYPQLEHIRAGTLSSRLKTKVDFADYTQEDLRRIEQELRHAIWRSEQHDAPRVPGKHCRWCKAQANCKERATYITTPLHLVKAVDQLDLIQKIGALPPALLGYYYQRKSDVNATFEIMEARLKSFTPEQLREAGYELAKGVTSTKITDVGAAFTKLGEVLTPEQRLSCINLVEGRAIELVAAKETISKEKAKAKVRALLAPWLKQTEGNKRLKLL